MQDLILIGGGGHCRSVIDVIEAQGFYRISAIVDQTEKVGMEILSYKITHTDDDLPSLVTKYKNVLITIGQIKTPNPRTHLFEKLTKEGAEFATVISPRAYVSRHSKIGKGSVVLHGAVVNAGTTVGMNCIINSQSLVEHDCTVEDHCHISTGAILNGKVCVRSGSFIGSGSVIREGLEISKHSVIAAGTILLKRVEHE
jgi:sugar O-acyltransferase (sialic acid O-acetyltransferase NeuD family)